MVVLFSYPGWETLALKSYHQAPNPKLALSGNVVGCGMYVCGVPHGSMHCLQGGGGGVCIQGGEATLNNCNFAGNSAVRICQDSSLVA